MTLKDYLTKNYITYRSFAEKVGIDAAQLARYANGSQLPNLKNAYKIFMATKKVVDLRSWFKGKEI